MSGRHGRMPVSYACHRKAMYRKVVPPDEEGGRLGAQVRGQIKVYSGIERHSRQHS